MARMGLAAIFEEARRRRAFQVVAVYIVGAFVALQVADLAFPGMSIPESAIQYIWIGAVIGLPFALFFGWRFDLVGGRILRTAAVDGEPGSSLGRGDKLTLAVMIIALLAICAGLVIEIAKTRVEDPGRPRLANAAPNSLAVLPFANFGGVQENEYLADGITETLLHALAQASGLKVTARTSSFFYKGKDIDVRDIAAELGVSKILEGSVQQSGDKIRIVAQLIEADTGFHLWSNTYDRDLGDIFSIQDSISNNVAIAILATLTAAPGLSGTKLSGVTTTNLEAYQLYLHGLEQLRISSNISLPKAETYFSQALVIDPDFYEATKELSYTYYSMMVNGTIPASEAMDQLPPLRDKMLEQNPDDGVTIWLDAFLRKELDGETIDADGLIAALIAAIERNPSDTRVYFFLSYWLRDFDRQDEAIEWLNRAIIVDPMDFQLQYQMGRILNARGEWQAAVETFERLVEINPHWPSGHSSLGWAAFRAGDPVRWYEEMSHAAALDPLDHEMEVGLSQGLAIHGLYEESSKHVARASEINAANGGEWNMASGLSLLGDPGQSRILIESFLRSELTVRGGGHRNPVWAYVTASINADAVDDALAVIEEVFPGTTSGEFTPTSAQEFYVQFWATVAWAHGKEASKIAERLDVLEKRWDVSTPNWRRFEFLATISFLRGDMEEASRIALEHLADGRALWVPTYQIFYPLKTIAAQPAVAARLAEIEEQLRPEREALRAHLEENN